jgi:hypothetical protein
LVSVASGLEPNGDIPPGSVGRLDAYGCTNGAFHLTLLVKQPGVVRIALDDREVRSRSFPSPTQWMLTVPAANAPERCRLTVRGTGLLGTTQLEFDGL